ncbi:MAG: TMEM165/GDT1 family protein [Steroidobacter sp.]
MDLKALLTVFATIFLAELGDKTQLATLLFAANAKHSAWLIFIAASLALVCAAGLGVLAGGFVAKHVDTRILSIVAGVGFIAIGAWTLIAALRA